MTASSLVRLFRRGVNRFADARIGAAPADVAVHRGINVGVGRVRLLLEQRRGRHQLAGLTVAALRDVVLDPRGLQRMQLAVVAGESFDRCDPLARSRADGQRAGAVSYTHLTL